MKYVFPAIFTPEEKGMYSVSFPDIKGCYTCGDNLEHAIVMAEDALCLTLYDMEINKDSIPSASSISSVGTNDNEIVTLIRCDTEFYKRFYKSKAIKKTLSIPEWLNEAAIAQGLNFSQILQDGIKSELNLR